MSYANVAAHNAPPVSEQPQPDQGLLTTPADIAHDDVADDAGKVNVVPHDFKENPVTITSETTDSAHIPPPPPPITVPGPAPVHITPSKKEKAKGKFEKAEGKAKEALNEAEEEGLYYYHKVKDVVLRPHVAGGLIGVGTYYITSILGARVLIIIRPIVNLGLIAAGGYLLYTEPRYRRDARALGAAAVGSLAIFGAEGALAESYLQTPEGQEDKRRAKAEGSYLYKTSREHVLRPGVLGGLVGVVNLGVIGALGYVAYDNWNKPHWDRRTVSAVSAGLIALWGGEG